MIKFCFYLCFTQRHNFRIEWKGRRNTCSCSRWLRAWMEVNAALQILPSARFSDVQRVSDTSNWPSGENPQELSSLYPSLFEHPWSGGLIVNSLPFNHSTRLSGGHDAGKTETGDKSEKKTEQGEGLCIVVCVHLFNDITGDACSNGVSVSRLQTEWYSRNGRSQGLHGLF